MHLQNQYVAIYYRSWSHKFSFGYCGFIKFCDIIKSWETERQRAEERVWQKEREEEEKSQFTTQP